MTRFLVLFLAIVAIEAGTRRAHPGEEQKAISLWAKYCANEKEGGMEGNVFIHCKHPLELETHTLHTAVTAAGSGAQEREQYIFIQPPSLHFNHRIAVQGGAALEPKTIVYVKPAKTSHSYQADLRIADGDHKKPELVFLSTSGNGGTVSLPVSTPDQQGPVPEPISKLTKRETESVNLEPVKITQSYSVVRQIGK